MGPLSISMSNAIRYLKREAMSLERGLSLEEIRTNIEDTVDDFINVNFTLHPKAISETANKKIRDGDVILTFSHSMLVEKVLLDAAAQGKNIKVIVADGRVQNLGRALCPRLVSAGIHSTYLLASSWKMVAPCLTITSRRRAPFILFSVSGVECRSLSRPSLVRPSLWRWNHLTPLRT